jgi:SAM-dependent methyltransferase
MNKSKKINHCRLCKSKEFNSVIDFGKVPLGNNLSHLKNYSLELEIFRLCLVRCKSCKHFQLDYEVSPDKLYATNYTYLSGVAKSFAEHFDSYSNWIIKRCNLNKNNLVLDVGSNDGTCLSSFKKKKIKVLGIDPAKLPAKIANKNGIKTINKFFNKKTSNEIKKKYGNIDFITSHNVLAHIGNITEVFENIFSLLKYDGYFCFEVGYFLKVLENNYFDTIYHEHLDYHHASPLVKYLNKLGFSIVNINTNKIQGGSLRILCKKNKDIKIYSQPLKFLLKEKNSLINDKIFINKWPNEINNNMTQFSNIIRKYLKEGKNVIGYGAPTKATLILKMSNIRHNSLSNIIEDNDLKVGKYMPKTDIKIIKYSKSRINNADVIIIFAWNFFSDIIKKLKKDNISNKIIIVPLPKVKIFYI